MLRITLPQTLFVYKCDGFSLEGAAAPLPPTEDVPIPPPVYNTAIGQPGAKALSLEQLSEKLTVLVAAITLPTNDSYNISPSSTYLTNRSTLI